MSKRRVELPSVKWLTGNNIMYSRNTYTGSYGTDPFGGMLSRTTFAFRAAFVMPKKPEDGEKTDVRLDVPAGLEAAYRLVYRFGHKPPQSGELTEFFPYTPTGGEPREIDGAVVEQAEKWLNDRLEELIKSGEITEI